MRKTLPGIAAAVPGAPKASGTGAVVTARTTGAIGLATASDDHLFGPSSTFPSVRTPRGSRPHQSHNRKDTQ